MPPKKFAAPASESEDESDREMNVNQMLERFSNTNFSRDFLAKLPEAVRLRTELIIQLEEELSKNDTFAKKELELRRKYEELYLPLYQRRKEIVTGTGAPVTEEEIAKGFPDDHKGVVSLESTATKAGAEEKGLPGFWLKVLQHHVVINSMITERDEEVLKHLIDVSAGATSEEMADGSTDAFAVAFTFEPNEFFEEEVLILSVIIKDDKPKLHRTPITWKAGHNVTVELVKSKAGGKGSRGKGAGKPRVTVSEEPCESFFNIFQTPEEQHLESEGEIEVEEEQTVSFMRLLYQSIVPGAVRYYTGEAPDGDSDVEDDDDDDDEDDDDEDEEEEEVAPRGAGRGGRGRGGAGGAAGNQESCKQN